MRNYSKNHKIFLPLICAITAGAYLLCMSGRRILNCDDMAVIHITMPGLTLNEMFQRLLILDIQPPLVAMIEGLWLRIVPVNYILYKIPSIIATTIAIYLLCRLCYKHNGTIACILMGVMIPLSNCIFYEGAFSMRPYGFLFLTTSWAIYLFDEINQSIYNKRKIKISLLINFGLSLLLLVYTHYFGIFVFLSLGVAQFIVVIKEKKILYLLPFIVSGICFLPWVLGVMLPSAKLHESFWPPIPNLKSIGVLISYMCGWNGVGIIVLIFSILFFIFRFITASEYRLSYECFLINVLWLIVIIAIGIPYMYSCYGNSNASVWVHRYFIIIMPPLLITISFGITEIQKKITGNKIDNKCIKNGFILKYTISFVFISILLSTQSIKNYDATEEPYESAIRYLNSCQDLEDNTTVLISMFNFYDAFNFLYADKGVNGNKKAYALTQLTSETIDIYDKIYILTEFYPNNEDTEHYIKNLVGNKYKFDCIEKSVIVMSKL